MPTKMLGLQGGAEEQWIQKAIKRPGALHKALGIPKDQTIPMSTLRKAAKLPGVTGRRARLAITLRSFQKGGGNRPSRVAPEEITDEQARETLGQLRTATAQRRQREEDVGGPAERPPSAPVGRQRREVSEPAPPATQDRRDALVQQARARAPAEARNRARRMFTEMRNPVRERMEAAAAARPIREATMITVPQRPDQPPQMGRQRQVRLTPRSQRILEMTGEFPIQTGYEDVAVGEPMAVLPAPQMGFPYGLFNPALVQRRR